MAKKTRKQTADPLDLWKSLTWHTLDSWVGGRSATRGRSYQRQGRVEQLGLLPDGAILATVRGTTRYVVKVEGTSGAAADVLLEATCTCPVGVDCKHAAAAVLELLNRIAESDEIPGVSPDDPRLRELAALSLIGEDSWDEEGSSAEVDHAVREHIRAKSHDELVEWMLSLLRAYPEMFAELRERVTLETQTLDDLVKRTRAMIAEVTAEPAWANHWNDESSLPDYAPLEKRLEHFLKLGRFDDVIDLGDELLTRGMIQVGESHDEGETAMALGRCMKIVFEGLAQSARPVCDKLLFAIEAELQDDYGVLDEVTGLVLDEKYSAADWSPVADALAETLRDAPAPGPENFSENYQRQHRSAWLLTALEQAGRDEELTQVYERETRLTGDYRRYVRYLVDQEQYDQAETWAAEGVRNTSDRYPGITGDLIGLLAEIARRRKDYKLAAAYEAYAFFSRPSLSTFRELLKAAGKARCKAAVQEGAKAFLTTGRLPWRRSPKTKKATPDWPLPVPDILKSELDASRTAGGPHLTVLLDIALHDHDPTAILHWYDAIHAKAERTRFGLSLRRYRSDEVAEAVRESHPDRALDIYRRKIQRLEPHADPRNYEEIAICLRKMKPIYESLRRGEQWNELVDRLRTEYRRRPTFVEALDRLDDKPIVRTWKER
ncbi:MAG: SWIM zinc finger family protein [Planctomycetota bacterium]